MSSASCQTELTWVLTVHKNTVAVQSAHNVLSVSESSEQDKGLAEPLKKMATGSALVQSAAGLAEPDISAPKGLAGPSKTASKSRVWLKATNVLNPSP